MKFARWLASKDCPPECKTEAGQDRIGAFRFFLANGGDEKHVAKAMALRRHRESNLQKGGLVGVKRCHLQEKLGLSVSEVQVLCSKLDALPGRSYVDEIFKEPEHKRLGPALPG